MTFSCGKFNEIVHPSITKICLKITCLKFNSNLPGPNELKKISFYRNYNLSLADIWRTLWSWLSHVTSIAWCVVCVTVWNLQKNTTHFFFSLPCRQVQWWCKILINTLGKVCQTITQSAFVHNCSASYSFAAHMDRAPQKSLAAYYWRHFRRNIISVGYPLLVGWAILADLRNTRVFKKRQAELKAAESKDLVAWTSNYYQVRNITKISQHMVGNRFHYSVSSPSKMQNVS